MVYRRIYNRIYSLMKKLGIETYTPEIGRQFLEFSKRMQIDF